MYLSIKDKTTTFDIELTEDTLKDFSCDHWISSFEVTEAEYSFIQNQLEPSHTNGSEYLKEPLTEDFIGELRRFYNYAFGVDAEHKLPESFKTKCENRVDDLRRNIYYNELDVGTIDQDELRTLLHLFDKKLSQQIRSKNFFFKSVGLQYLQDEYIDKNSQSPALFLLLKEELFTEGSRIHEMIVRQGYTISDDGSSYIRRN